MRKLILSCCTALALALVAAPASAVVTGTTTEVSYTGNGATTAFGFTFKATDKAWVKVSLGGVAQASGFTVTLNANQGTSPGGTVTFAAPPATGATVKVQRTIPLTQSVVLKDGDRFPAKSVEGGLDRAVMLTQQVDRRVADAEAKHAADVAEMELALAQGAVGGNDTYITATGAMSSRKLKDRFADVINVKDYGAAPDDAIDDTAAFVAALQAAWAAGGAEVRAPRGRYRLSSSINLADNVGLRGDGIDATVLEFTYDSPPAAGAAIQFTWGYNQALRDLTVQHKNAIDPRAYADNGSGIALFWPMDSGSTEHTAQLTLVENVLIKYFTTGVRVPGESTWLQFKDMRVEAGGTAFSIKDANAAHFLRCVADSNQMNWYLENTMDVVLDRCTAQTAHSTTLPAIQVLGCSGTKFLGLWTERNARDSILLTENAGTPTRNTEITGGTLQGAGWDHTAEPQPWGALGRPGSAVVVGNAFDTIIRGGWFGGNTTNDIRIEATARRTVVEAASANDSTAGYAFNLSTFDAAPDTTWLGPTKVVLKPSAYGVFELPGSTGSAMTRPAVWPRANGEIAGTVAGTPTSDAGFLRLCAGGGTTAGEKTCIDISGYSNVTDMARNIVLFVQGQERVRLTSSRLTSSVGLQHTETGAAPTCDATNRGLFWHTRGGAGVTDSVQVCAKDASDAYAWRPLY
jgi:hypothetical protein